MKYLNILNATLDGIVVSDLRGNIQFTNHAADAMLGYETKELLGHPIEILMRKDQHAHHTQVRNHFFKAPKVRMMNQNKPFKVLCKNGDEFSASISLNPLTIEGEKYVIASIQDLSPIEDEKRIHEQTQKLAALGEMVGGIAHNFNNVLAGISGQAYLIDAREPLTKRGKERIESVQSLCLQAADIIRQLLLYTKQNSEHYEKFNLTQTLTETCSIAKISLPDHITLKANICSSPQMMMGKKSQIAQVILNMVNNAVQAIGNKEGLISVTSLGCIGDKCQIEQCKLRQKSSKYTCIRIQDTGEGIAKKNLQRIFDPFFTTKSTSEGTGLGLSTSFSIVEQHAGELSVSSHVGQGTIFQLFLPLEEANEVPREAMKLSPVHAKEKKSLLIVDDNQSILYNLQECFIDLGYEVFTAKDGEEGVSVFFEHASSINLIISDLSMPKLSGAEMQTVIREKSDVPFLFVTGYQSLGDGLGLPENDAVVIKPFDFIALSQQVADLVESA